MDTDLVRQKAVTLFLMSANISVFQRLLLLCHYALLQTQYSNLAHKMQTTLHIKEARQKENNVKTFTHGVCIVCMCVCRTKPGKKMTWKQ